MRRLTCEDGFGWYRTRNQNREIYEKLKYYEDMEEQGKLIDAEELTTILIEWQRVLKPNKTAADIVRYNMLENVIEQIANLDRVKLKELEE